METVTCRFLVNFALKKKIAWFCALGHPEIIEASILKHFLEVWMHKLLGLWFLLFGHACVRKYHYTHAEKPVVNKIFVIP